MSCPDCDKGVVLPGTPSGTTDPNDGSYFASAPAPDADGKGSGGRAILLLTDAFGLSLQNPKIIADRLASELKCDVWVPDLFAGWPVIPHGALKMPDRAGYTRTWTESVMFYAKLITRMPALFASRPSVAEKRVDEFVKKHLAPKGYAKVGAVGYCYGGTLAVMLADKDNTRDGGRKLVDSVVIAHPGRITVEQVDRMDVPSSWACAEEDPSFNDTKRAETEARLAARDGERKREYEFKVYPGTHHGFASRPNLELPKVKEGYEGAFKQTVDWFEKTLVV